MNRRDFIKGAAAAGGGLLVAIYWPRGPREESHPGDFAPCAWLRISPDDKATFILDRAEMGQGVITALPQLLAEELDLSPTRFTVENAPAERRYDNPHFNLQLTGGSSSLSASWTPLREAGARARQILVDTAAEGWKVPAKECETDDGVVIHRPSNRRATYGSLVGEAAKRAGRSAQVVPKVKAPNEYRHIGKPVPRLDLEAKVTGRAGFGIDVKLPGMLTAVIIRPPRLGARLMKFSDEKAKASPGFRRAFAVPQGVAVVATGTWEARTAAGLVEASWSPEGGDLSTAVLHEKYAGLAKESGKKTRKIGDFEGTIKSAAKVVEATYEMPFLAHATMEPQNFTAHVTEAACELWGPTQAAGLAQEMAAAFLGLAHDKVKVHTTFLGGGFGRRLEQDYVVEAVAVAREMKVPVKVVWTREDDMRHDFYRPASLHVLKSGLDAEGRAIAHSHRIVSQSILAEEVPKWFPAIAPAWIPRALRGGAAKAVGFGVGLVADSTASEGASDWAYDIPNVYDDFVRAPSEVPVGFWRSVGHSYNGFVVESFIDELAAAAGKDPLAFRRALLGKAPRHLHVLELVAEKAKWGKGMGIAQHASFGSYAAQVAQVEVTKDGEIKVKRVVCAIDCGIVVNPDIVRAQVESGILFGLSAALKGEITFEKGAVTQSNFHDYPVARLNESPEIEVHLVESGESPSGVGEVAVPPIGPAVGNAVFALTGKRLRKMPFRLS